MREEDLATLFAEGPQSVRVTRMRADLTQAALANDLVFQASQDQSVLSNIYTVTQSVNTTVCPPFDASACVCSVPGGGNGSSNGASSGGNGSGEGSSNDGGRTAGATPASRSSSSSGCAMGPADTGGSEIEAALMGFLGLVLIRTLKKKR